MNVLEFKNIKKTFDGVTPVLQDISFNLPKGKFLALLGPSGCGKTTLLRLIAGLEVPTEGEIWLQNNPVATKSIFVAPEKRHLGMMFQSYAMWPHKTVYKNISYPLEVQKLSTQEIKIKISKVLTALRLTGLEGRYPHELSGGQQQRVALGRALVMEPTLLLLDEPLSNLDANLRIGMRREILELKREYNTTIVYVTHDQAEAIQMADVIILLHAGQIEQMGHPQDLLKQPSTPFVKEFLSCNAG